MVTVQSFENDSIAFVLNEINSTIHSIVVSQKQVEIGYVTGQVIILNVCQTIRNNVLHILDACIKNEIFRLNQTYPYIKFQLLLNYLIKAPQCVATKVISPEIINNIIPTNYTIESKWANNSIPILLGVSSIFGILLVIYLILKWLRITKKYYINN